MRRLQPVVIGTLVVILLMVAFESGSSAELFLGGIPTSKNPPSFQVEAGTFNVQIQAIEVTQGVRGEIPSRVPPGGDLVLHPDGAIHVANRRTIVRVYPWVESGFDGAVPPLTASIWAYRDGVLLSDSPISPENYFLENISADWYLGTMRDDAGKSWNFLLPPAWTASDSLRNSFSLRFVVEVNPSGPDHQPECQGCSVDNQVFLGGQEFVTVPTLVIQPYIVEHTVKNLAGNQVVYPGPTADEFEATMRTIHNLLPVGDLDRGLSVLPPTYVDWQGLLYANEKHVFAEAMISEYLPGGDLKDSQDGVYHIFIFSASTNHDFLVYNNSDGMWLGLAWAGKPYAQSGARGLNLVHELTHAIGLSHAGNKYGETTTNPEYPDEYGRVEPNAFGFDIWEMRAIPPISDQGETHDYMSYNSLGPTWVSLYTWKAIANLLGQTTLDV